MAITEFVDVEVTLTDQEMLIFGKEMGEKNMVRKNLEDRLKAVKDDFKAQISEVNARLNVLGNWLNTGRQMRNVECEVKIDFKNRVKKYYSVATGELVKSVSATDEDMQLKLG